LWKEETGYGFSLYSTPSENLCDRFCRLDTQIDGVAQALDDGHPLLAQRLAVVHVLIAVQRVDGFRVKARVAPILYMEGACGVRLKADDDVSEIFKNGRATPFSRSASLSYMC
jgi:anaerobic ribonucleoside-triphosphate reductase